MVRLSKGVPAALVALVFLLAACGSSTGDRGLSGAGIGAAAGTAVGAVTGLGIIEGALIGAGAGGLTGALTDEDTIDLGDPWW
jgi:osmotically inducible lipoprotein OsmB